MTETGLPAAADWSRFDPCDARNLLERAGWRLLAAGDWAVVLADPSRNLAVRISPFELAYQHFVGLCVRLAGNAFVPRIDFACPLSGGGHLTVMELLTSREVPDDDAPDPIWSRADDADIASLRSEVERVDEANQATVPWWGGIDVKADHWMVAADGQLKLIDPFYVAGARLFGAAQDDYEAFCEVIPASHHRHMLAIPHFSQSYAADELVALRAATRLQPSCLRS